MIIHDDPQGTDAWVRSRVGVITASMFSVARSKVNSLTEQQQKYVDAILRGVAEDQARKDAGYKASPTSETIKRALRGEKVGEPSEAANNYAFNLAVERISGEPCGEIYETWQMRRGRELEEDARIAHEVRSKVLVEPAGFITTNDRLFGCSADGFIGTDEGSEYKAFLSPEKLRAILLGGDLSAVMDQIQGGLWITNRKRWHFGLYCPALKSVGKELTLRVVERDEDYIERLVADLIGFNRLVEYYREQLTKEAA